MSSLAHTATIVSLHCTIVVNSSTAGKWLRHTRTCISGTSSLAQSDSASINFSVKSAIFDSVQL